MASPVYPLAGPSMVGKAEQLGTLGYPGGNRCESCKRITYQSDLDVCIAQRSVQVNVCIQSQVRFIEKGTRRPNI
jgi:hypothetical protein